MARVRRPGARAVAQQATAADLQHRRVVAQLDEHRRVVGGLLALARVAVDAARRAARARAPARAGCGRCAGRDSWGTRACGSPTTRTSSAAARTGGSCRRGPRRAARANAARSGSRAQHLARPRAGSCTSRSSGATLKSPPTARSGWRASSSRSMLREGREPAELVGVLVGADGLAVGHVHADRRGCRRPSRRSRASARRRSRGCRSLTSIDRQALAHEDRHAVVGLLPGEVRDVAGARRARAPESARPRAWFPAGTPRRAAWPSSQAQEARQAHGERVDVPGGDLHRRRKRWAGARGRRGSPACGPVRVAVARNFTSCGRGVSSGSDATGEGRRRHAWRRLRWRLPSIPAAARACAGCSHRA